VVETRRLGQLVESLSVRARWPKPPYLVALSGGADSAVLASLAQRQGVDVRAIHVHHGLESSDQLAAAAERIAESLDMPIQIARVEVPDGSSMESQARDVRYRAFENASEGVESVLTGHTKNDVAETVLINLIRGTGTRGLAGIPYHREPNTFRPLLGVSRTETREYAILAGLDFLDDPTNFDRSIRRNWIRLEVIPLLQRANPAIVETLSRTADHLLADAETLDLLFDHSGAADSDSTVRIAIGDLVSSPDSVRWRLIDDRIGTMRNSPAVSSSELERIAEVIAGKSGGTELEGGLRVTRDGPFLQISDNNM
jgi:tRNA(Ile)-lysidine synthase